MGNVTRGERREKRRGKRSRKVKGRRGKRKAYEKGGAEMRQESVFITNEGQFVSQTADKKLITTSSTIENPLLSLHVRAPICDILEPLCSVH